jgi:2-polyprenyl-3-methyl-5-hydroxy-6-metoxy-1,4-benzoquinol methylase
MKICPVCQSKRQKSSGNKNNFELLRCVDCQTLYAYSSREESFDYTTYYDDSNLNVPEFVKFRLSEIVGEFDRFRKGNRLLDIGCGAGYLLEEARKQNWQVMGMEISDPAVESLRKRGFNIFQGDLSEMKSEHNSFDVIVSTEVLEHVSKPGELAEATYKLLRQGGLFWGTTPNGNGISARIMGEYWSAVSPPEHLQLFSAKALKGLLKKAGFSETKVTTHGVNPFEMYHFFRGKLKSGSETNQNKDADAESFDRVNSSYQLNEALSSGAAKTIIKKPANILLNTIGLGDSLKFWAIK